MPTVELAILSQIWYMRHKRCPQSIATWRLQMALKLRLDRPDVVLTVSAVSLLLAATCNLSAAQSSIISLITDAEMGPAARHGVGKVQLALQAMGLEA
ncbi:MAG: hypothetical protein ACYTBS_23655, partial [Planctomycetota bacterium]